MISWHQLGGSIAILTSLGMIVSGILMMLAAFMFSDSADHTGKRGYQLSIAGGVILVGSIISFIIY